MLQTPVQPRVTADLITNIELQFEQMHRERQEQAQERGQQAQAVEPNHVAIIQRQMAMLHDLQQQVRQMQAVNQRVEQLPRGVRVRARALRPNAARRRIRQHRQQRDPDDLPLFIEGPNGIGHYWPPNELWGLAEHFLEHPHLHLDYIAETAAHDQVMRMLYYRHPQHFLTIDFNRANGYDTANPWQQCLDNQMNIPASDPRFIVENRMGQEVDLMRLQAIYPTYFKYCIQYLL